MHKKEILVYLRFGKKEPTFENKWKWNNWIEPPKVGDKLDFSNSGRGYFDFVTVVEVNIENPETPFITIEVDEYWDEERYHYQILEGDGWKKLVKK